MIGSSAPSAPLQLSDLFSSRARAVTPSLFGAPASQTSATTIRLAYGLADPALFPVQDLSHAAEEVLTERSDTALNYSPPSAELLEQIVNHLQGQGIAADTEHLMLSYGSSQTLALLPQVLLDPGDTVIIEGPSFLGAVHRFELAGAQLVTIATDADGMDVDALETILANLARRNIRPKLIYTIPTFHNPTGVTLPLARRKRLVALAAQYGILIVEDDAYGSLCFTGQTLPPLAALDTEGWVLHIGTFSKILTPGLRVGYALGRPELLQRLLMLKPEGNVGPFITHMVARYCANGRLAAHIDALQSHYRHKCRILLDSIEREFPADVRTLVLEGGFFVWCTLPPDMRAASLLPLAEERGVTFLPGTRCYANGQGEHELRLAFSYHSAQDLVTGVERLGDAMRALRGE